MLDLRPIHDNSDYEWALNEASAYFENEPQPGSDDGNRFEIILTLLKDYEDRNYPIPEADPIEILHFAIENLGRSQSALADILGSRSRASEILNRKRYLNLNQIRAISEAWGLPFEALAKPYELAAGCTPSALKQRKHETA